MFHKTSLRLTGLYLTILMLISVFFSLLVYSVSARELDRGFRRQAVVFEGQSGRPAIMADRQRLDAERALALRDARGTVAKQLIIINMAILVLGGGVSYLLARKTLLPIEDAHESLERFTSDASHELRTPIAAMQIENEIALSDPQLDLKKAKKQFQSNLEELAKLTSLTEGLLQLARSDEKDFQLERQKLLPVIEAAVLRVKPLAEQKNISITYNKNSVFVNADSATLGNAIVALLDNAIKYSSNGGKIEIGLSKDKDNALITITDQGIGMTKEVMDHAFERFYRANEARSKNEISGYGLGLALAKQIITLHHGQIQLSSTPKKGSTFTLKLPAA